MDFSDKYILMCKKAEEIQSDWETNAFDIYQDKAEVIRVVAEDYGCDFRSEGINKYQWEKEVVWIFRQDQLQEILFNQDTIRACFYRDIHGLSKDFYLFAFQHPELKTFEQLWLAFIMQEIYSKEWSKEKQDWIIIKGDLLNDQIKSTNDKK